MATRLQGIAASRKGKAGLREAAPNAKRRKVDAVVTSENVFADWKHADDEGQGPDTAEKDMSKAQKVQTEIEKTAAKAKRAVAVAEVQVAAAKATGEKLPPLDSLLVSDSWRAVLAGEFKKGYFKELEKFVRQEANRFKVFPPPPLIFRAFNTCAFDDVKVVLLGQDPYHGEGQAMGLCFSVPGGIRVPPSLQNIYKELKSDLGFAIPNHGNLEKWANQGVFLLNTVLTVRERQPNSHAKKGWEKFTDEAIKALSKERKGLVFMLWGKPAQVKSKLIDSRVHHILQAAHPSGLSANKGFFGCKHFSMANSLLEKSGRLPVDWQI